MPFYSSLLLRQCYVVSLSCSLASLSTMYFNISRSCSILSVTVSYNKEGVSRTLYSLSACPSCVAAIGAETGLYNVSHVCYRLFV